MEKRKRSQLKDLLVRDENEFLREIAKSIKCGDEDTAKQLYSIIDQFGKSDKLSAYDCNEGETLLHTAVKHQENPSWVQQLVELCPALLHKARESSENFHGQTALHIAITKGNASAVDIMISRSNSERQSLTDLLHTCATGSRFVNTVMMGELPLSVAALKNDMEIVDLLIDSDVDVSRTNSQGDTVFHSLVKYAAVYPEKIQNVIDMMQFLNEKLVDKSKEWPMVEEPFEKSEDDTSEVIQTLHYSYVWFIQNEECLTPLQLAAKHGLSEVFEFILNIKDVYCYVSAHDGLFDVKLYDISEIDTVSNFKTYKMRKTTTARTTSQKVSPDRLEGVARKQVTSSEMDCFPCCYGNKYPDTESVLEMMYDREYSSRAAFRIIELPPVKNIVKSKWSRYRYLFAAWLILHFAFMIMYTVFGVERARIFERHGNSSSVSDSSFNGYVLAFQWFALCVGILYCIICCLLLTAKLRRKHWTSYFFHNLEYILPLLICSLAIVVDVIVTQYVPESFALILALIFGWWFCVFFLSPFRMFSFFAEMVKRVIIGDMLRFGLIITFELIAFTAGMYIVFRGSPVEEEGFESVGDTLLTMFKLGIGLGDIEKLYSAKDAWAAVLLFVLFLVFTYLLMLNALIAMMSQTCALVLEERYPQWRIQQLSVILLLEDILCVPCFRFSLRAVGDARSLKVFDPKTKHSKTTSRYCLEIHSLQMEYATEEDKEMAKKKRRVPNIMDMNATFVPNTLSEDMTDTADSVQNTYMRFHRSSFRPRSQVLSTISKPPISPPAIVPSPSVKRKKSVKSKLSPKSRSLETLEEELPENTSFLHPYREDVRYVSPKPPDVILSDRSPKPSRDSKRKRHHSENLHEKETRNAGIQHSPPPEAEPILQPPNQTHMARLLPNGLVSPPGLEIRNYNESHM